MKLLSPAKINLFLNILRKREDGYHEITTLFERISLSDEITLLPAKNGITISTNSKHIPAGPKNLAYQAAALIKNSYGIKHGITIRIKKRIPVAAGLGGGSSNAATVLMGLNRLWRLNISKSKLCEFGASLGSDVPFFILEASFALGKGRGEILKKIHAPGVKIWHCLVKPSFGISTKEAYQNLGRSLLAPPLVSPANASRLHRNRKKQGVGLTPAITNVKMLLHSIQKGDSSSLTNCLTNSLEVALNKRVTIILKIKNELLRTGALSCLLSGSGPTVFGIYSSEQKASKAARILKKHKSWQVFMASTH